MSCGFYSKLKEILETKVNGLEGKVKQLEGKVWQLETRPNPISTIQKSIHRNCHEMFVADVSLMSGRYLIDPDGNGAGDDPIQVDCEKTTGKNMKLPIFPFCQIQ